MTARGGGGWRRNKRKERFDGFTTLSLNNTSMNHGRLESSTGDSDPLTQEPHSSPAGLDLTWSQALLWQHQGRTSICLHVWGQQHENRFQYRCRGVEDLLWKTSENYCPSDGFAGCPRACPARLGVNPPGALPFASDCSRSPGTNHQDRRLSKTEHRVTGASWASD